MKRTAYNERFCEMAAIRPQTILWEIQRYYFAASSAEDYGKLRTNGQNIKRSVSVLSVVLMIPTG